MGNEQGKRKSENRDTCKSQRSDSNSPSSPQRRTVQQQLSSPDRSLIVVPAFCPKSSAYRQAQFSPVSNTIGISTSSPQSCATGQPLSSQSCATGQPLSSPQSGAISSVGLFTHHDQQNKNTQISADPYEATTETANFCKIARLILDVCNAAMRDLLQCKLSGGELILTQTLALNRKKIEHHLLDIQKKTLFPPKNGLVKYRKLDFTLMYSIVRNVCPDKIEPNSTNKYKWGKKPVPGDTSLLAAIERIRACRNEFFAHATEAKICDSEFKDLWASLEQALFKIDDNLGSASYRKEMKNIRKMQIDPESNKRLQELTEKEAMLNALIEKDVETDQKLEELMSMREKFDFGSKRVLTTKDANIDLPLAAEGLQQHWAAQCYE